MKETKLKLFFSQRIPSRSEILAVYSITVMLIYGWSTYWFIWNLSSWISFLTSGEIWAIYCYTAAVNFIESVSILIGIVCLCIFLPPKWMRDNFVWHASSIVSLCLIYLMVILAQSVPISDLPRYAAYGLIIFVILHFISIKTRWLRTLVEESAERSIIFLYISIPISIVALISLMIRNIQSF
jgi:hypothetical protein